MKKVDYILLQKDVVTDVLMYILKCFRSFYIVPVHIFAFWESCGNGKEIVKILTLRIKIQDCPLQSSRQQ